ncbi:MAG: transcriptional regulator [Myxococcales bacterium]|nr:transcriptional regulator [Myxococcales bacterium]
MSDTTAALLTATAELVERVPPLRHLAPAITGSAPASVTPSALPVLSWLPEAAARATPLTRALVRCLVAASPALAWRRSYGAEVDASFLASYGWVDLVGAHGPRRAPGLRLGFLLLGARTRYPPHAHAAEEHYVPLSGAALWTRGRSPPALQRPGALIHHPPWEPHATETTDEPLLALYVWRGARLNAGPRWEV